MATFAIGNKMIENYFQSLEVPNTERECLDLTQTLTTFEHSLNSTTVETLFQLGKKINALEDNQIELTEEKLHNLTEKKDLESLISLTELIGKKLTNVEEILQTDTNIHDLDKYISIVSLFCVTVEKINEITKKAQNISTLFRQIPHAARFMIDVEGEFQTLAMEENQISPELFQISINEIETILTNIFVKILLKDQKHIQFFLPKKEGDLLFFPLKIRRDPQNGEDILETTGVRGRVYNFPQIMFDILLHPLVKAYDKIKSS